MLCAEFFCPRFHRTFEDVNSHNVVPDDEIKTTANGLVRCEVKEAKMDSVQLRKQEAIGRIERCTQQ